MEGMPYVICMFCNAKYTHPYCMKSAPTTALKRHIQSCAKYQRFSREESRHNSIFDFFPTNHALQEKQSNITKEILEEQVLKFFISANISFNQAENEHFQKLIS